MNIVLIGYASAYFLGWKAFLDIQSFSFLKPYAIIWIFSAFVCLLLSKNKRQIPFLSFFIGSIFGPAGVLMLTLSMPDFRSVSFKNRNESFYADFQNEIGKLKNKISRYKELSFFEVIMGRLRRQVLYNRLNVMAEAVNLKLNFPLCPLWEMTYKDYLGQLWNIENALKDEQINNVS